MGDRVAQAEFDKHRPQVVVGSSWGGAVAMNIDSGEAKLVLLCPAWKKYRTARMVKPDTVILHSRADDVKFDRPTASGRMARSAALAGRSARPPRSTRVHPAPEVSDVAVHGVVPVVGVCMDEAAVSVQEPLREGLAAAGGEVEERVGVLYVAEVQPSVRGPPRTQE